MSNVPLSESPLDAGDQATATPSKAFSEGKPTSLSAPGHDSCAGAGTAVGATAEPSDPSLPLAQLPGSSPHSGSPSSSPAEPRRIQAETLEFATVSQTNSERSTPSLGRRSSRAGSRSGTGSPLLVAPRPVSISVPPQPARRGGLLSVASAGSPRGETTPPPLPRKVLRRHHSESADPLLRTRSLARPGSQLPPSPLRADSPSALLDQPPQPRAGPTSLHPGRSGTPLDSPPEAVRETVAPAHRPAADKCQSLSATNHVSAGDTLPCGDPEGVPGRSRENRFKSRTRDEDNKHDEEDDEDGVADVAKAFIHCGNGGSNGDGNGDGDDSYQTQHADGSTKDDASMLAVARDSPVSGQGTSGTNSPRQVESRPPALLSSQALPAPGYQRPVGACVTACFGNATNPFGDRRASKAHMDEMDPQQPLEHPSFALERAKSVKSVVKSATTSPLTWDLRFRSEDTAASYSLYHEAEFRGPAVSWLAVANALFALFVVVMDSAMGQEHRFLLYLAAGLAMLWATVVHCRPRPDRHSRLTDVVFGSFYFLALGFALAVHPLHGDGSAFSLLGSGGSTLASSYAIASALPVGLILTLLTFSEFVTMIIPTFSLLVGVCLAAYPLDDSDLGFPFSIFAMVLLPLVLARAWFRDRRMKSQWAIVRSVAHENFQLLQTLAHIRLQGSEPRPFSSLKPSSELAALSHCAVAGPTDSRVSECWSPLAADALDGSLPSHCSSTARLSRSPSIHSRQTKSRRSGVVVSRLDVSTFPLFSSQPPLVTTTSQKASLLRSPRLLDTPVNPLSRSFPARSSAKCSDEAKPTAADVVAVPPGDKPANCSSATSLYTQNAAATAAAALPPHSSCSPQEQFRRVCSGHLRTTSDQGFVVSSLSSGAAKRVGLGSRAGVWTAVGAGAAGVAAGAGGAAAGAGGVPGGVGATQRLLESGKGADDSMGGSSSGVFEGRTAGSAASVRRSGAMPERTRRPGKRQVGAAPALSPLQVADSAAGTRRSIHTILALADDDGDIKTTAVGPNTSRSLGSALDTPSRRQHLAFPSNRSLQEPATPSRNAPSGALRPAERSRDGKQLALTSWSVRLPSPRRPATIPPGVASEVPPHALPPTHPSRVHHDAASGAISSMSGYSSTFATGASTLNLDFGHLSGLAVSGPPGVVASSPHRGAPSGPESSGAEQQGPKPVEPSVTDAAAGHLLPIAKPSSLSGGGAALPQHSSPDGSVPDTATVVHTLTHDSHRGHHDACARLLISGPGVAGPDIPGNQRDCSFTIQASCVVALQDVLLQLRGASRARHVADTVDAVVSALQLSAPAPDLAFTVPDPDDDQNFTEAGSCAQAWLVPPITKFSLRTLVPRAILPSKVPGCLLFGAPKRAECSSGQGAVLHDSGRPSSLQVSNPNSRQASQPSPTRSPKDNGSGIGGSGGGQEIVIDVLPHAPTGAGGTLSPRAEFLSRQEHPFARTPRHVGVGQSGEFTPPMLLLPQQDLPGDARGVAEQSGWPEPPGSGTRLRGSTSDSCQVEAESVYGVAPVIDETQSRRRFSGAVTSSCNASGGPFAPDGTRDGDLDRALGGAFGRKASMASISSAARSAIFRKDQPLAASLEPETLDWVEDIHGMHQISRPPSTFLGLSESPAIVEEDDECDLLGPDFGGNTPSAGSPSVSTAGRRPSGPPSLGSAPEKGSHGSFLRPRSKGTRGDGNRYLLASDAAQDPAHIGPHCPFLDLIGEYEFVLSKALTWDFDVRELVQVTAGRPLEVISTLALRELNLYRSLPISVQTFASYIAHIEKTYSYDPSSPNPYHSSLHGADVAQAVTVLMKNLQPTPDHLLSPLDRFVLLFSAIIHDYRHPGLTNTFLVGRGDEIALRYNDCSVLENFSIAEAFRLMYDTKKFPNMFGLAGLSSTQFSRFRKAVISCVLATDLSTKTDFCTLSESKHAGLGAVSSTSSCVVPAPPRTCSGRRGVRPKSGRVMRSSAKSRLSVASTHLDLRITPQGSSVAGSPASRRWRPSSARTVHSSLKGGSSHVSRQSGADGVTALELALARGGSRVQAPANVPCLLSDDEALNLCQLLLKISDVSHPTRPLRTHIRWFEALQTEFFAQGRKELEMGIPVSPLCDPSIKNIANSQIGFINFVVRPLVVVLTNFQPSFTWLQRRLDSNYSHWEEEDAKFQAQSTQAALPEGNGPEPTRLSSCAITQSSSCVPGSSPVGQAGPGRESPAGQDVSITLDATSPGGCDD